MWNPSCCVRALEAVEMRKAQAEPLIDKVHPGVKWERINKPIGGLSACRR